MSTHRIHVTRRQWLGIALCATLLGGPQLAGAAAPPKGARVNEKFIISGASGQLGELAIKEFLARGVPAKNLILVSRSPEKLDEYKKMGAVTRFGDVDKPESLAAAYKGGTRMIMISLGLAPGDPPRPPRHKLAFDAAAKAGVKQIAYTSFVGAGEPNPSGLAVDHAQTEAFLRASGVSWTALRNAFYMDNQLPAALKMAETGKATVRPNEAKSAPVTREDCAAVAVGALLYPGHENKVYEITGPDLIDTAYLAKLVSEITGKPVTVETAAPAAGRDGGAPPAAGGGTPASVSTAVADLTGRPATSLKALLEAHRAELVAAAAKR